MKRLSSIFILGIFLFLALPASWALDQWEPASSGLTSQTVTALAAAPNGHLFAGVAGAGVFRSTDRGISWTAVGSGLPASNVTRLAAAGSGRLFAGTRRAGIFSSADDGDHWTPINQGIDQRYGPYPQAHVNAVDTLGVTRNGDVFMGYRSSYNLAMWVVNLKSTDNGNTWSEFYFPGYEDMSCFLETRSGARLAAATMNTMYSGIFRSTGNDQTTWTHVFDTPAGVDFITALAQGSGDCLLAGTGSYYRQALFRSFDDGRTWTDISHRLPGAKAKAFEFVTRGDGEIFMGSEGKVYRSVDNGWTWEDVSRGLGASNVFYLALAPDGTIYAGTEGDGVFRSTYLVPVALSAFSAE